MSEVVREMPAKGVVMLRINRPEARNALNMRVRRRLAEEFQSIHGDDKVRAVVLTGDDKAFAAGADLKEFAELKIGRAHV